MKKQKTSLSLTEEAQQLLKLLAETMGISKSDVLELIIREAAKQRDLK